MCNCACMPGGITRRVGTGSLTCLPSFLLPCWHLHIRTHFAPCSLIRDPKDMEALSELGVLFLLFEMGLELSLDRLKARAFIW